MTSNKKFIIIINFLLLITVLSCSNESNNSDPIQITECETNNITDEHFTLSSQERIDLFLENNYSEVGGITVAFQADLSFLECIRKVGVLRLNQNTFENLEGLSNLEEIGDLIIIDNSNLINLEGLGAVESLNSILVESCENIINLEGLESLVSLNGSLIIKDNPNLQNLNGLNNLTTTPEGVAYLWEFSDNPNLTNIEAINNLNTELSPAIWILNCHNLEELGTFPNISTVTVFYIANNSKIESINCFPNSERANSINISNCTNLNNISFPAVTSLGYLAIRDNPILTNINFMELTEFSNGGNGDFSMNIEDNYSLATLNGFENLTYNNKIIHINVSTSSFENPLINICSLRNLFVEQINSGTFENVVRFQTQCGGLLAGSYNDISQFDAICDCE